MTTDYIAVVGSGVVGLAAAAGFAKRGYPVALCGEMPPAFDPAQDEDLRVFALNDASCTLLRDIGVWDAISTQRLCYYERMLVWSGGGCLRFNATDIGRAHLGVVVENCLLRSKLFEHLRGIRGTVVHCPAQLQSMHFVSGKSTVRLVLDNGSDIEAALVIGADGADSKVRAQAGIGYNRHPYGQHAIVATVTCEREHRNTCLQRFSGMGVTAFLPLSGGEGKRGSIVWSCDRPLADELDALPNEMFCDKLAQTLEYRLAGISLASKRASFPLYGALAGDYIGEHTVLVGDAAHSVHPLAGQGANMGLADVRKLLDIAAAEVNQESGLEINRSLLRRYQRGVKGRNAAMKYSLDAIHGWFARQGPLIGTLQSLGLNLVDRCLPLKAWFIEQAAGPKADPKKFVSR